MAHKQDQIREYKFILPEKIQLVQAKTALVSQEESLELTMKMNKIILDDMEYTHKDSEVFNLEKTEITKVVEEEIVEDNVYYESPILVPFDDEII